jgi:hypothetical protein
MVKYYLLFTLIVVFACRKKDDVVFSNNNIPDYTGVPTILVKNYINRLYVDVIGRQPTDTEMNRDVQALRSGSLNADARTALVNQLMFSTEFVEGDSSYKVASFRKLYEDQKSRYLNSESDGEILDRYNIYRGIAQQDSLQGDMLSYSLIMAEANKILAVYNSKWDLQNGTITAAEMCRRMMFNALYDDINMNTFNFINATFDNSLGRFPTDAEMSAAYDAVESSIGGSLFGLGISSKPDYLNVFVASREFQEGQIRWVYRALLSRDATSPEAYTQLSTFTDDNTIQSIQKKIMITDEYAGF